MDVKDPHNAQAATTYVDINVMTLLRYLVESLPFILACVLVAVTMTACGLRDAAPSYEANMVVAPPTTDSGPSTGSALSSVLSTLGGGGGGSSPQFDQFQYKMTSPSVVEAANADGQLYTWIYGSMWDARKRSWKKPDGVKEFLVEMVRAFFHKPGWIAPDEVMTSEALSKQIGFEAIPKSSLTKISYQNSDPGIATAMLQRLYNEADRQIREQERLRLKAQMANAIDMLSQTQVSDLRMAMAQQLAQSQYRLMIVPGNAGYSAREVEPPFVSPLPVSPKIGRSLAMTFIFTLIITSFLGIAYRLVRAEYTARGKSIPMLDSALRRVKRFFSR